MTAPAHWPDGPLLSTLGLPMSDCFCWHDQPQRECLEHGQSDEIDALLDVVCWDLPSAGESTWNDPWAIRSALLLETARDDAGTPVRP